MLPEGLTATNPETFNCYIPDRARRNGIDTWGGYFRSTRKRANKHLDEPVKGRYPVPCLDAAGVPVLAVPLDQHGQRFAPVDPDKWVEMQEAGLIGLWGANRNGSGVIKVRAYAPMAGQGRSHFQVGRWILNLAKGEEVHFLNGDPTDLRVANMSVRGKPAPAINRGPSTREKAALCVNRHRRAIEEGRTFSREGTTT